MAQAAKIEEFLLKCSFSIPIQANIPTTTRPDLKVIDISKGEWKDAAPKKKIKITSVEHPSHMYGLILNKIYYVSIGAAYLILEKNNYNYRDLHNNVV